MVTCVCSAKKVKVYQTDSGAIEYPTNALGHMIACVSVSERGVDSCQWYRYPKIEDFCDCSLDSRKCRMLDEFIQWNCTINRKLRLVQDSCTSSTNSSIGNLIDENKRLPATLYLIRSGIGTLHTSCHFAETLFRIFLSKMSHIITWGKHKVRFVVCAAHATFWILVRSDPIASCDRWGDSCHSATALKNPIQEKSFICPGIKSRLISCWWISLPTRY